MNEQELEGYDWAKRMYSKLRINTPFCEFISLICDNPDDKDFDKGALKFLKEYKREYKRGYKVAKGIVEDSLLASVEDFKEELHYSDGDDFEKGIISFLEEYVKGNNFEKGIIAFLEEYKAENK